MRLLQMSVLLLALAACGTKGALYLPKKTPPAQAASKQSATETPAAGGVQP